MKQENGTFIVIEGTDGSGKGTQFALLAERLAAQGYDVATFDFPQYDSPSSFFVREYLNGRYGSAEEVGPYTGSLFYALDRFQASQAIREALSQGKVVLANRFVGSNMAHQGTKFHHAEERRGYFIWLDNLEFEMLRTPRPTVSFVLRVPAAIAQKLVDQKATRHYTDKKRDLHEADLHHLEKSVEVYDDMCRLFPKDFIKVDCVETNTLLTKEEINDRLWEQMLPLLPPARKGKRGSIEAAVKPETATEQAAPLTEAFIRKRKEGGYEITDTGRQFLDAAVTDTTGNVYAFTDKLSSVTIAAAMARLSRRGDDMRVTILDEFAAQAGKDEQLLQRVITAYGDDSVQQLAGIHFVVENTTKLMTNFLEWGRLAAYLEQSTRYIYFDQKDAKGHYKFYIPADLKGEVRSRYIKSMNRIFDQYSMIVRKLTDHIRAHSSVPAAERDGAFNAATRAQACDAARHVLPTATTTTIGFYASGQALESLIMHLLSHELPEARNIGQSLLEQARQVMPVFLERADKPDRGGATIAYRAATAKKMQQLAQQYVPDTYAAAPTEPVTLVDYWPRNEFDLVPDMLYEHTSLPLKDLQAQVATWPYARKDEVFSAYMGERLNRRHRPGRALEKAHYSWDLVCDFGIFCDLMRHRMVDDLEWQAATPRYGYEMPELIEEAGLTDLFEDCFDTSLQLYSLMQEKGHGAQAQYATLLGHRMRWKVTYNAREAFHLHELRTSPQGHPGYRKLVQQMHEKLATVHPALAEAMQFVNQGEDPELSRLAAERYTQFKLEQLDAKQGNKTVKSSDLTAK